MRLLTKSKNRPGPSYIFEKHLSGLESSGFCDTMCKSVYQREERSTLSKTRRLAFENELKKAWCHTYILEISLAVRIVLEPWCGLRNPSKKNLRNQNNLIESRLTGAETSLTE